MITVEEYVGRVLATAHALPGEEIAVTDAAGRTLTASIVAEREIPAFDNSGMDGFAVRYADVAEASAARPAVLKVIADLPAGTTEDPAIPAGTAARIMTGAPVPAESDAIVPFESTLGGLDGSLQTAAVIRPPRAVGAHIRRRGEDLAAGDEVLPAGTVLGPLQVASLIAAGVTAVEVSRRPRVVIASTGVELVAPGRTPGAGQIPDSNSTLLALLAEQAGADVVLRTRIDDDAASLTALLAKTTDVDVVITSGGVSAGAFEPVRQALTGTIAFENIAMQPGKPQAFGRLGTGALFFGLPGNPVSVAVSFEAIVRPALLAMQSRRPPHRPLLQLPAGASWRSPEGRRQYLPIRVDRTDPDRWRVHPATAGGSGSHLVGGLGRAEGYAIIPAAVDAVRVGDLVDVMLVS